MSPGSARSPRNLRGHARLKRETRRNIPLKSRAFGAPAGLFARNDEIQFDAQSRNTAASFPIDFAADLALLLSAKSEETWSSSNVDD
jgi:hypothetical protein